MGHVEATFDQRSYRFRNDDGSETSATWKAAENTPITQEVGQVFRLRIETQETAGGSANNQTIVLQSSLNGGAWSDVGPTSSVVRLSSSANVSDGTATTDQLTGGSGTFLPGLVMTETSGTNISFSGNDHTENEWASLLLGGEVADGDTIDFRTTINGATSDTVTASPSLTASVSNISLTPLSSSHAHTSGAPTVSESHPITPAGSSHAHTSGSATLTQTHALAPAGSSHAHTSGAATLDFYYATTGAGPWGTDREFGTALTFGTSETAEVVHDLTPLSSSHVHTSGAVTLTQDHSLIVAGASHAHASGAATLDQTHALSPSSSTHTHTSGSPTLAQTHALAVEGSSHGHTSGAATLDQTHSLEPSGSTHAHTSAAATVTHNSNLTPSGSTHPHTSGAVGLTQTHSLTVAGSSHTHTSEPVALTLAGTLSPQGSTHAHTSGATTLTQQHSLTVAGSSHSHTSGQVTLTQDSGLSVGGSTHAHTSGTVALTQSHSLSVDGSTHGHTSSTPTLSSTYVLTVEGSSHGHTSSEATVTETAGGITHTLTVSSSTHAHTSGEPYVGPVTYMVGNRRLNVALTGSRRTHVPLTGSTMTSNNQIARMSAGETRFLNYTIGGDSVDLTTATALTWEAADSDNEINKSLTDGITVTGARTCKVTLEPADTEDLASNSLFYELWLTDSGGDVSKLATGSLVVTK